MQNIFIRGSKIKFLILPDMLKNAPMFKTLQKGKAQAVRGKTAILRASAGKSCLMFQNQTVG